MASKKRKSKWSNGVWDVDAMINYKALDNALKDPKSRKELERIFAKVKL